MYSLYLLHLLHVLTVLTARTYSLYLLHVPAHCTYCTYLLTVLTARTYSLYLLHVPTHCTYCTYVLTSHRSGAVLQVGNYRVFGRRVYRIPGCFNRIPTAICDCTLHVLRVLIYYYVTLCAKFLCIIILY
jgi:hypothetical protein